MVSIAFVQRLVLLLVFPESMEKLVFDIAVFGKYTLLYVVGFGALFTMFTWFRQKLGMFTGKFLPYLIFAIISFIAFYSLIRVGGMLQNLGIYLILAPLLFYIFFVFLPIKRPRTYIKLENNACPNGNDGAKYGKTGLSKGYSKELKVKVERLMEEDKLFMDPELRLDKLAGLLHVSRHHTSQVINENFDMSFNDYINAHRIAEAKKRLCSGFKDSTETMSDIAYACGFNNRASFYRAFKKFTQLTPKEFLQKVHS